MPVQAELCASRGNLNHGPPQFVRTIATGLLEVAVE
jgi:hypothetical protein